MSTTDVALLFEELRKKESEASTLRQQIIQALQGVEGSVSVTTPAPALTHSSPVLLRGSAVANSRSTVSGAILSVLSRAKDGLPFKSVYELVLREPGIVSHSRNPDRVVYQQLHKLREKGHVVLEDGMYLITNKGQKNLD